MSTKLESNVRLAEHRSRWYKKPVLREIYSDLYEKIVRVCVAGPTVEIGGGSGNLKEFLPEVISFDIASSPWLDLVADAQQLPFVSSSIANFVMFDVLHHIEYPAHFFSEAQRTLKPGGRIIMIEPAVTPISWAFYNFFHEEPVVMKADPLSIGKPNPDKDPFVGNQAIPTLLATKYSHVFKKMFPELQIVKADWMSLFCYPLSGGFKSWCLIPKTVVKPILRIENTLSPILGRFAGFRLLLVLEKDSKDGIQG